MSLESEFTAALHGTYETARARGYIATYFLQMLEEYEGVGTAQRLLVKTESQPGLYKLWELHLLHTSMEAVVLQERFHSLFEPEELAEARRRLDALGYFDAG
jgi:hypothetical protein